MFDSSFEEDKSFYYPTVGKFAKLQQQIRWKYIQ